MISSIQHWYVNLSRVLHGLILCNLLFYANHLMICCLRMAKKILPTSEPHPVKPFGCVWTLCFTINLWPFHVCTGSIPRFQNENPQIVAISKGNDDQSTKILGFGVLLPTVRYQCSISCSNHPPAIDHQFYWSTEPWYRVNCWFVHQIPMKLWVRSR